MEVDLADAPSGSVPFNGTVPIKRARMDLITTGPNAAQLRRRKEAEKEYGRGRKIPGLHNSQSSLEVV
jgi:U3 small nucleolar RNA-associated protein 7